jgi:hypothetical protein
MFTNGVSSSRDQIVKCSLIAIPPHTQFRQGVARAQSKIEIFSTQPSLMQQQVFIEASLGKITVIEPSAPLRIRGFCNVQSYIRL